jgi:hypothetical protein
VSAKALEFELVNVGDPQRSPVRTTGRRGALHLCKSVPGGGFLGITYDSAKICGGGYVGCGIGLAHDKSALPGI